MKVLISGASIAGPCLAYWLNRAGIETTVIERAPQFRDGGQNIDIKGVGQTVVERMGLLEKVKANTTSEKGLRFVDDGGETIAAFPKEGALSITQEIEILRGNLARVFYEATHEKTEYRFGLTIKSLNDRKVEFSDGSSGEYDLVVSTEGIGSSTRKLVMNEFVKFKYLGVWMAFFRIPRSAGDDKWARWHNAAGGRVIMMRPSTPDAESVVVDFRSEDSSVDHEPIEAQRERIREVLNGMGWQSSRISDNLEHDDDLYMGPLSQVKASRWSKGRFVMVGDAAYAPTPVTGMGTTLAIAGAYVLAGEIAKSRDDIPRALASYERILRPFVEKSQSLPPGVPLVAHPRSRAGIVVLNSLARIGASKPIQALLSALPARAETDKFALPDYQF